MVKYTTKGLTLTRDNSKRVSVAKPLVRLIVTLQKELQEKENKKQVGKRKKITFVYASLVLERNLKRK